MFVTDRDHRRLSKMSQAWNFVYNPQPVPLVTLFGKGLPVKY